MKNIRRLLGLGMIALFIVQCETPESPNFTLNTRIDAPLIASSNFQFLGGTSALIDTTDPDLEGLFFVDGDNFVTLSKEEEFDFGDLNDAIPEVDVEPTSFESQVGEIELGDFSSQDEDGNLGEADFSDLTGQPIPLQEGDPIPGAQSPFPVNIELDTDFFESAIVKRGGLEISLRNELGFDVRELSLELRSGNTVVGSAIFANLEHSTTRRDVVVLVANPETDPEVELTDLNLNVEIEWDTQVMQADAGSLIINDVVGNELFASQVVASVPPQEFFSDGVSEFSDEEFLFTDPSHFVELESGLLVIQNIINQIDVDLDVLEISFPGIRTAPFGIGDSLVIRFDGDQKIPRNNVAPISRSFDLSNARIFAEGNEVVYNIQALTEDTQAGNGTQSRVINENDRLTAEVAIENLTIAQAFGVVVNKQVTLNEDDPSNGDFLDLLNDQEAEIIEIDGIDDLSEKLEGLEFVNSSLSINYFTNIDVPATVIGAFLGEDANGNQFFLSGLPGTPQVVGPADPSERLQFGGNSIPSSDLIKFELETTGNEEELLTFTFDRNNSNITEFLNRLPIQIRFIGLANINENGEVGSVVNPVRFDPVLTVNIPLALRADAAVFTDTTSTSLSELPGQGDDSTITEGFLRIQYTNGIPLGFDLVLDLLDESENLITSVPLPSQNAIHFDAAPVSASGFVTNPTQGVTTIELSRAQLDIINRTEFVRLVAGLQTFEQSDVKVRDIDSIEISISGRFEIDTIID
ncbi:MAG: hypothetical protein ACNA78_02850 [Balneolaceae bacterium]